MGLHLMHYNKKENIITEIKICFTNPTILYSIFLIKYLGMSNISSTAVALYLTLNS